MTKISQVLKDFGLKRSDFRVVQLRNPEKGWSGKTAVTFKGSEYIITEMNDYSGKPYNEKVQIDNAIERFVNGIARIL